MALKRQAGLFISSLRREAGFSLAEILIAGLIMTVALLPMVGMFDGARSVSMMASDINQSGECLRLYVEQVKNIPFYEAHTMANVGQDLDVDDYYWGSRSLFNNNAWSTAPWLTMKQTGVDPYPDMLVEVRMAYIDDALVAGNSLEQAAENTILPTNWGPKALYGFDRPKTVGGKMLTVILYEVKVTTGTGRIYSRAELSTSPTDVVANIYIDKVINVSADASKIGQRLNSNDECVSAPHTKNDITVRAYGSGFDQSLLTAGKVDLRLVRVDDVDVPVTDLTFVNDTVNNETYLEGTISLGDGNGIKAPWGPQYRAPGYWQAWLVVNHIISVKSDAFAVECPRPVYRNPGSNYYDSDNDKEGQESAASELITFTNVDYFTNLVPYVYPNPGIGYTVQLVHTTKTPEGEPIDIITGTNFTVNHVNGYATLLTATVRFDFRGHIGGDYMVRIVNCVTRATADIDVPGNTYADLDDAALYYYLEGPPAVDECYVYEATPTSTQLRHFGYDDRGYTYTLEIKGYNFDNLISANDIVLGMGGNTSTNPPTGAINETSPISAPTIVSDQTIQATFDFAPNVDTVECGQYWLYVRNSNGFGRALDPAFDIRQPAPIIYSYKVNSYGLWQNYFDVDVDIEGECFDQAAGTSIEVMIKEAAEPANDWLATQAMSSPVSSNMSRHIDAKINLVDCNTGIWELYVRSQPAGLTDSGYQDFINGQFYLSYADITVSTPLLRTPNVPSDPAMYSLKIASHYKSYDKDTGTWSDWSKWYHSVEGEVIVHLPELGTSTKYEGWYNAWSIENDPLHGDLDYRTMGEMYFEEIRGMGFNKGGTMQVQAMNDSSPPHTGMNKTWTAQVVHMDRATAKVWIQMDVTMAAASGPDEGGEAEICLRNDINAMWCDWYKDRFVFRPEG